jgi:N-acetyl sugar amidotransferase
MKYCKLCIMPDTRPDTPLVDGVCVACIAAQGRERTDWAERSGMLKVLANRIRSGYKWMYHDVIVPASGGKDSTYQVLRCLELGLHPLVVTATTCHLTEIGRANLDNLKRFATVMEISPNIEARAKLNVLGAELVGDISWPEHVSIFSAPFRVAEITGIKFILYGENPQNQYGGPADAQAARRMTSRWRSEFGGFLGLRPSDLVGVNGLTPQDLGPYILPTFGIPDALEAHFLGFYEPWDSHRNARVAIEAGMKYLIPEPGAYWPWENLDNAQTGIHDWQGFLKYGYTRAQAQLSVDIRSGLISRDEAIAHLRARMPALSGVYGKVPLTVILGAIGQGPGWLHKVLAQHTNRDLFHDESDFNPCAPRLKVPVWA